jgi:catechol 2,3-dioxygenase-like lactoylglutathione lyase family enzyme
MRVQLALNVNDLEAAIDFYSKAFDVEVTKRRPGYANFSIDSPPLKLVLFKNPGAVDCLNHLGVEVFDDEDVQTAAARFAESGIEHRVEEEEVCCYAPQNKVITHDPDGTMFEWYRVLGDSMTFFGEEEEKAEAQSST